MEKKLEDYLHLYLPYEIKIEYGYADKKSIGLLTGFRSGGGWEIWPYLHLIAAKNQSPHQIVRTELVKPILRKLSSMSEEERKELWQMVFSRPFRDSGNVVFIDKVTIDADPRWVMSSGVERLGIELSGNVWADSDLHHWKFSQHEVTRFLLSKQFDLFNLIESGLAIDASTIKPLNH